MKIAFFELQKWEKEYFHSKLKNHKLLFFDKELSSKDIPKIKDVDALVVVLYSKITGEIIHHLPYLKVIFTMSTGFDHIDVVHAANHNIPVYNVPFYGENTVAEFTFALILALSRKIFDCVERTKDDSFDLKGLKGFDLKNKTLGVIGPGHIGQHVIRMANGFEMKVIACAHHKDLKLAKKLNFNYVSLENLLKNSDIITLHCPMSKENEHLINMKNIKLIKKGSYLINTARGQLVDTNALFWALDSGHLAGAALDVLEEEESMKHDKLISGDHLKLFRENHKLLKEKNVIITPHNAFNTQEALIRIIDTTIENINEYNKNIKNKKNLVSF
jgi:D-lactate dehydrogenase